MYTKDVDCKAAFVPIFWVLMHPGTNGQITSWGENQAGSAPNIADA
ncbi:hypothetical protein [Tamaricihabitans halophyticus]|nr:hypothetical protein [Tamaricihabitans halophyticus]